MTAAPLDANLASYIKLGVALYLVGYLATVAYRIRLGAINEYGRVIHEFDPYFNYRATEYLYQHGAAKFFTWFDHMSWYPLGRPVGTTIYPGMQFTSVWIKQYLLKDWSINDICVFVPTWFGALASLVTGLISYECTLPANTGGSLLSWMVDIYQGQKRSATSSTPKKTPCLEAMVFSMGMMAIVPAHLMRSMGGGYDNESIAMTAMVSTFYGWIRSLRTHISSTSTIAWAVAAAVAYFYMVAAWGGYVFVINMIGVHAALLAAWGRLDTQIYTAYTVFYVLGTFLATRVPVVGFTPLKSLEQLGPCAVFVGYQILYACERIRLKRQLTRQQAYQLRFQVIMSALVVTVILVGGLTPTGYFGPLSARVRGLFVQHTKTGNPLVDSVAEHQPASGRAYFQYLHHVCSLAPLGYLMVAGLGLSDASSFLLAWGTAAYFFSHKMVRLILLTAPIGCSLGGIAAAHIFSWCLRQLWDSTGESSPRPPEPTAPPAKETSSKGKKKANKKAPAKPTNSFEEFSSLSKAWDDAMKSSEGVFVKRSVAICILFFGYIFSTRFVTYCWRLSYDLSNPSIIQKAQRRGTGEVVVIDDYREAYMWLHDNTPEDARVMAWWDYGYQIAGIANRTTIADGNTWNHEHIALLGMALTTNVDDGYEIARHLADYILVWAGGGGDDLAKSPHLARIANSVYRDHCGADDPTCRAFGFLDRQGTPSAMMRRSMLYHLHSHKIRKDVEAPLNKFREVFHSKYGKVRIFKVLNASEESRAWVANPANRLCDVPGSWFCPGQYPPALSSILAKQKDFQQLGDFNFKGEKDDEYTKKYFEDLLDPKSARRKVLEKEAEAREQKLKEEGVDMEKDAQEVDAIYRTWEDTEDTTTMWQLINNNDLESLKEWLRLEPHKAFMRSKDGRGPMWWAFEHRNEEITQYLMSLGVPHADKDANGVTPAQLLQGLS